MPSSRYADAFAYAEELHREQRRKGTGIPYISHLMIVSAMILEHGGSEDQAIAGLLHDAAEDQGATTVLHEIRRRYGQDVARMVEETSDSFEEPKPPWRARKEAYLDGIATKSPDALLVSLADKVHNAESIAQDVEVSGPTVWGRFTAGRDGTLWYYRELLGALTRRAPGALSARLERAVCRMETA